MYVYLILETTFNWTFDQSFAFVSGNTHHHNLDGHISTSTSSPGDSDPYTSMEALNNSSFGDNRRTRVKVLPDIEVPHHFKAAAAAKPMPSRTNPNVVFKRPNSMSSMMYWFQSVTMAVCFKNYLVMCNNKRSDAIFFDNNILYLLSLFVLKQIFLSLF